MYRKSRSIDRSVDPPGVGPGRRSTFHFLSSNATHSLPAILHAMVYILYLGGSRVVARLDRRSHDATDGGLTNGRRENHEEMRPCIFHWPRRAMSLEIDFALFSSFPPCPRSCVSHPLLSSCARRRRRTVIFQENLNWKSKNAHLPRLNISRSLLQINKKRPLLPSTSARISIIVIDCYPLSCSTDTSTHARTHARTYTHALASSICLQSLLT